MDELNREVHTMSDVEDESFIVLGSSPTPSMEQCVSDNEQHQESMTNKRWTQSRQEENNAKHIYNQVGMNDEQTAIIEQLKEENNKLKHFFRTAEIRATEQEKRATELEKRAANLEITLERTVDETKNQIQAERAEMEKLKKNVSEKESILKNIIDQLKEKNYKLEKLVHTAENQAKEQEKRATEQEKRADNLEITHERAVDEAKTQIKAERVSALAEMDELKKNVSEKESILKNTIDQYKEENHRLEQLVHTAETRAKEQEKRVNELEKCLTEQEKRVIELEMCTTEQEKRAANLEITLERALAEMDELKKNVSEKESILKNTTDQLKEENHRLEQLVRTAETQATEQEKRAANLESALVEHVNQNLEERGSALAELDKLKKDASDKESIRKNMAQRIERLELEKQELVIAKQKQLDTGKIGVNFITIEEHDRQIELLHREISTIVANNLESEEMVPTTIIPTRIMENLNVLLHDAGRASLKQIRLLYDRPLINLGKHNPSLSELEVENLALVKGTRRKLNQMQRYLTVCRIADELRLVHENIGDRQYLMQAVNVYSISDLLRLENGELPNFLLNVLVVFQGHIRKCEICSAKAYNCEDCQNGELLFPFDEDAIICTSCYSMSHRSCLARQNQFCQKCRRLLIRRKLGERS